MTSIPQSEGVIKFDLDFRPGPASDAGELHILNAWRQILRRLGLLGQDPKRYAGFGFGNLSCRLPGHEGNRFLISGTQTGGLEHLRPEHYVTVIGCEPVVNRLRAQGPIKPSSESLSHGVLYLADPAINWVMHLHSPDIFRQQDWLELPCTDPAAAYGTPEMAAEIERLAKQLDMKSAQMIVMSGHEDGILAFGQEANQVGALVISILAQAMGRFFSEKNSKQ